MSNLGRDVQDLKRDMNDLGRNVNDLGRELNCLQGEMAINNKTMARILSLLESRGRGHESVQQLTSDHDPWSITI